MTDFLEERTPKQIQQSVKAAFDSVNLINNTVLLTVNDQRKELVNRNVGHLRIMLGKTWFNDALTATEKTAINTSITNGDNYVA
jgi:hypothetical protein